MFHIKNYKFGFDAWGMILFILIMLPNFIWFAVPAPYDVLRSDSITPTVDIIAQVFQVLMVAALCIIVNTQSKKPMNRTYKLIILIFVILYFIGWILYYSGIANTVILLVLCIAPCAAFILFSYVRKNGPSFIFASMFMICHLIYGIVNFIA